MRKHFKARALFQEGVKDDNVYQIKAAVYRCFNTRSLQEEKYKFTLFRTVAFLLSLGLSSFVTELYMPLRSVSLI